MLCLLVCLPFLSYLSILMNLYYLCNERDNNASCYMKHMNGAVRKLPIRSLSMVSLIHEGAPPHGYRPGNPVRLRIGDSASVTPEGPRGSTQPRTPEQGSETYCRGRGSPKDTQPRLDLRVQAQLCCPLRAPTFPSAALHLPSLRGQMLATHSKAHSSIRPMGRGQPSSGGVGGSSCPSITLRHTVKLH